jgi:hypothetical protein
MIFTVEKARELLEKAGVFYYNSEDADDEDYQPQVLNMNDTWCWASAWGERVPDEKLPEVATLFWRYGYAGILYWMSEQHEQMRSEFEDINRFVDFVREEERIRAEFPDSSKRAYYKARYTLPRQYDQP